jgi:hypothetical protein
MSVRYLLPVVLHSYTPYWRLTYRSICAWRWVFRGGGE